MVFVDYSAAELLFTSFDLRASLEASRRSLVQDSDVAEVTALSTDEEVDQLISKIATKHMVAVPELNLDNIYTTSESRSVDVSHNFGLAILDRSQPVFKIYDSIVFHIPFVGDRELFFMRASTYSLNPPRAEVVNKEVRVAIIIDDNPTPEEVRRVLDRETDGLRQGLSWVSNDLGANYNARLAAEARDAVVAKRNRLRSTRALLDDLGFSSGSATAELPQVTPATSEYHHRLRVDSAAVYESPYSYDFFISHASEDKDDAARPLYECLNRLGYRVWFDEAELRIGDSLIEKIDEGLSNCRFGIVIMSTKFFEKQWTMEELKGLRSRQVATQGPSIILPVWKDVDQEYLNRIHPPLAQVKAAKLSDGIDVVVSQIAEIYSI